MLYGALTRWGYTNIMHMHYCIIIIIIIIII